MECINLYMALHIADAEVSRLASELAKIEQTSKTEALRRLLREALQERSLAAKRQDFRQVAFRIAANSQKRGVHPVTKEDMDALWSGRS